eukprot:TRINITY_DN3388_c0_g1_i1.p1 TRINITY_DN3388_c0_g1~~TRINITY_DN3388_c0_g1_i1.p1  ORF type:complete len:857 (+),score=223.08 TRINITY_DN3388_c0_g1_i1:107-2677(+)
MASSTSSSSSQSFQTPDWNALCDRSYRTITIYEQMKWAKDELEKSIVVGAPFGGPVAMVKDMTKVKSSLVRNALKIFTSAGKQITELSWEKSPDIVGMGWTDAENIVIVCKDASVSIYSLHSVLLSNFSLGSSLKEMTIAEAQFWGTGLVVRTPFSEKYGCYLYSVTDLSCPVTRPFASVTLDRPPTCMAVIPPRFTASNFPEVLLGTDKGSIVVVDANQCVDMQMSDGPFVRIAVSPTGKKIACFNDKGVLLVISSDFSKNLSKFGTSSKVPPKNMVWCGDDAVVLYWDKIILLVGAMNDFVKYSYPGAVHLVSECDGVRILTGEKCQFLQRVPDSTESIMKVRQTTPSAMLFDAADAFEKKQPKADENIRVIKERKELPNAIDECLNAAAHEFDFKSQKSLLKSAAFGKLFADSYRSDTFVDMCRILRVLNAVRHIEVGIPLTYEQFLKLDAEVLVDRLINRHHHLLALRICKYLRMPQDKVLVHWACAKIRLSREEDDKRLGELIVNKLNECPSISYSNIATTAFHAGRHVLATELLKHEPRAADQVPLFMSMKNDEMALQKAIDSGDADLVFMVVLHISKTKDYKDFFALIRDKPSACSLYLQYCKARDPNSLQKFLFHQQRLVDSVHQLISEAYRAETIRDRLQGLKIALQIYREKSTQSSSFLETAMKDQIDLLELERDWDKETMNFAQSGKLSLKDILDTPTYMDKSVSDLVSSCIQSGQIQRALSLKKQFNIPDKRFWHLEVRTLARSKSWEELAKLGLGKSSSPIGYEPFVEACVEQKNMIEAARYIERLSEYQEQLEWYCTIGRYREAIAVAVKNSDKDALLTIKARAKQSDTLIHRLVDEALKKM